MDQFIRTEAVIGKEKMEKIKNMKVIIFGVGGVGSNVVESLARIGVGNLTLVDFDKIDISNLNRQVHTNIYNIGKSKVVEMRNFIEKINPKCSVKIFEDRFSKENEEKFFNQKYDYVVDAIDSVTDKLNLIRYCFSNNIKIVSSMGTGNKIYPQMLEIDYIKNTSVCPLAKVMRKELKKSGITKLKVVYSKENPIKPKSDVRVSSTPFVPAVAGQILSSIIINETTGK